MPKTVWRPNPFTAAVPKEPTHTDKIVRLIKRNGGIATRKEVASCVGMSDGKHIDDLMQKAGVALVGTYKNKNGKSTNLYGFKA